MAAEPVDHEQAGNSRNRPDNRVGVRRHFVQSRPRVRDRRIGQRRQPAHRDVDNLRQEIPLHGGVERRRLVGIGHPEQDAGAFTVEIERRVEVDDHDPRVGHGRRRGPGRRFECGNENVAPIRIDGKVDAGHVPDLTRVRAGGVHRHRRGDVAARRFHRGHSIGLDTDSGHCRVARDGGAAGLRRFGKPHGDAVGIGNAVAAAECRRPDAVDRQAGNAPRRLHGIKPVDVDAEAPLHRDVAPEGVDALVARQQEQVPVLMKVDGVPDFVGEPLEQPD